MAYVPASTSTQTSCTNANPATRIPNAGNLFPNSLDLVWSPRSWTIMVTLWHLPCLSVAVVVASSAPHLHHVHYEIPTPYVCERSGFPCVTCWIANDIGWHVDEQSCLGCQPPCVCRSARACGINIDTAVGTDFVRWLLDHPGKLAAMAAMICDQDVWHDVEECFMSIDKNIHMPCEWWSSVTGLCLPVCVCVYACI